MLKEQIVAVALVLVAAGAAVLAAPGVDEVMLPGERFRTLLANSGETRTVAVATLAGSRLVVTAKGVGKSRVEPRVEILDPVGRIVDGTPAVGGKKVTVKVPDTLTGIYRVSVSSPAGKGGDLDFRAKASKLPLKGRFDGALDATSIQGAHPFDALPGSKLSVKVASSGKPKWTPAIEVLTPSGATLSVPAKATRLKGVVLPELGTYTVRITGGVGAYKGSFKLKPQGRKARRIEYGDVEALPEVTGAVQTEFPNDGLRDLDLLGFGFSESQAVALFDGDRIVAGGPILGATADRAVGEIDTTGVAPGVYDVGVTTPAGNRRRFDIPITVTNLPPFVYDPDPQGLPRATSLTFDLRGAGFDRDLRVQAKLHGDGTPIPTTLDDVIDHQRCKITIEPGPFDADSIDLEFTEPSGGTNTVPGALEVYGFMDAPTVVAEAPEDLYQRWFYSRDGAYSDEDDSAVIAVQIDAGEAAWVRIDTATGAELGRLERPAGAQAHYDPRVSWNPVDHTWAMTWVRTTAATYEAMVTVVSGDDVTDEIATHMLSSVVGVDAYIGEVNVAADPVRGGWMVVWDEHDGVGSEVKSQRVAPDGSIASPTTIAMHSLGYAWTPVLAYVPGGRYVVVYIGATEDNSAFAIRRAVLDPDGVRTEPLAVIAPGLTWYTAFQPEIAVNPRDGTIVTAFSYVETLDGELRPGSLLLNSFGVAQGPLRTLDDNSTASQGYIDSLVWSETLEEFVLAMTTYEVSTRVVVRRMRPDGVLKNAKVPHQYAGTWGVLVAGSGAGTLGLYYSTDATPDDGFDGTATIARGARLH